MNIYKNKYFEIIAIIITIFISLILLTPGDFGERFGAETWKPWVASKLLLETGKFIQYSLGPLYYSLLTFLNSLNYEQSIITEYFITHLFCLFFIYKLVDLKKQKIVAILFCLAWLPFIAWIQSPKYILAVGFLCLHFTQINNEKIFKVWLPPYLLCAILCNWGLVVFLIGHLIGKIYTILIEKEKEKFKYNLNFSLILSLLLILLFSLTFFNKLEKPYNNHFVTNYKYAPIPLESPFEIAFFQVGNYKYSKREIESSKLENADWYFTNTKAFKDCKSFFCAVTKSTETVFQNIKDDFGWGVRHLTSLFFGPSMISLNFYFFIFFFIASIIISSLGLLGLIVKDKKKNYPLLVSITLGSFGYILALILTIFSLRYAIALLPVAIILILHTNDGLSWVNKKFNFFKKKTLVKKENFNFLFYLSFFCILITSMNFQVKNFGKNQFINISNIENIHEKERKINYFKSYKEIFSMLNKNQKILTYEDLLVRGFANVNPDKVYGIFHLPPFKNEETTIFLNNLDVIMVSENLKEPGPSLGTQKYLRYKIHLEKYLDNQLSSWKIHSIDNYGKIFVKKE